MEIVKRKISLEDFKNRFSKDTVDESKPTIADDIVIDELTQPILGEIANNIPILTVGVETAAEDGKIRYRGNEERYYDNIPSGANEVKILRYHTMLDILSKTRAFFNDSHVFQLCRRKAGRKMVEIGINDFLHSQGICRQSKTTPTITNDCVGMIEDASGNTFFIEDEDCSESSLTAYKIQTSEQAFFNLDNDYPYVVNNISIGDFVFVNNNIDWFLNVYETAADMGDMRAALNRAIYFVNFAEEKKHAVMDYEGFIPISLFIEEESEDMGLFTSVVSEFVPGRKYILGDKIIDSEGVAWTLIKGEKIINVAVPPVLRQFVNEQLEKGDGTYILYDSSLSEAVLTDLSHIYVDNNTLNPTFVKAYYNSLYFEEDEHWGREEDSSITQYTAITESKLSSYKKADIGDDAKPLPFRLLYNENNKEDLELLSGGTYDGHTFYKTAVPFIGVEIATAETSITFTYYAEENETIGNSALIYTETYPYTERYGFFNVTLNEEDETPSKCFKYLDIDFTRGEIEEIYDLYGSKLFAKLNATIERDGTESQDVPYFKEEELLGIHDVATDIDGISIERGASAAYERHSILGEIATLDDLVKYKNGFFKVIDNENNQ